MRFALGFAALAAVAAAQDLGEIVRRAVESDRANAKLARNHTFVQRSQAKEFDGSGKLKKNDVRTWDVTLIEGSPYRRLVMRDDRPVPPEEEELEQEKLRSSIEQRRKETKEQRDRRVAEWHRKQDKQRDPLQELPEAFDFRLVGEETVNGIEVWVIDLTPKPGYRPRMSAASFLTKVKARLWIEKKGCNWVKLEMETLDTVGFGAFLFRMSKGSRLAAEQTSVDGVWLPKTVFLRVAGRILLVKSIRNEYLYRYSNYRKFEPGTRLIPTGDDP